MAKSEQIEAMSWQHKGNAGWEDGDLEGLYASHLWQSSADLADLVKSLGGIILDLSLLHVKKVNAVVGGVGGGGGVLSTHSNPEDGPLLESTDKVTWDPCYINIKNGLL